MNFDLHTNTQSSEISLVHCLLHCYKFVIFQIAFTIFLNNAHHRTHILDIVTRQQILWEETTREEASSRTAKLKPTEIDKKLMHDVQMLVSRLVEKAPQLIDNFTTNLAEAWMHIRSKFDGGKVINRSQSGSWQHRCAGAGLQHNLGKTWGPQVCHLGCPTCGFFTCSLFQYMYM